LAYDAKTADRVRAVLSGRSDVVEKRMVGGLSFVVGGSMCCGVTATGLMVRVGPEGLDRALAQPHVRPMEIGGRALKGFVLVEPAGYRTAATLKRWVGRGLTYVATLPEARGKP
jgi:hypothetical protein